MVFVPEYPHAMALLFLGTSFLLAVAGAVFVMASLLGKTGRARQALLAAVLVAGGYAGLLFSFSLASDEKVLAGGEWKYFCELDCHLAYSVADLRTAQTLGSGGSAATAEGTFYVVTLKTRFDAETITARRPRGMPLSPNLREVFVVDEAGRRFATSLEGMKVLEVPAGRNVPLTQWLRPGESYETTLVFDLPADVRNPKLFLTDPWPVNWVLIGHENSFLHKKVYFRLEAQQAEAVDSR